MVRGCFQDRLAVGSYWAGVSLGFPHRVFISIDNVIM